MVMEYHLLVLFVVVVDVDVVAVGNGMVEVNVGEVVPFGKTNTTVNCLTLVGLSGYHKVHK